MIDLHSHLLPGIDDGPASMRDSLAMAQAALAAGTTTMVCTPHVLEAPADQVAAMEDGVEALRRELERAGIPLEVLPGAEVAIPMAERMDDDLLRRASLGGAGRWLLVEMPFRGWPLSLPELLADLEVRGFGVVLAHPERAESVQLNPDRMRDLVGRGALTQVTAGSLTGEHGPRPRRTAETLLDHGWVTVLASDAHSPTWRPPGMADGLDVAVRRLGLPADQVEWMVDGGPRAIVAGEPVRPPRLLPARRRPADARPGRSGPPRSPRRSA